MRRFGVVSGVLRVGLCGLVSFGAAFGQATGSVEGVVVLKTTGGALHHADVFIPRLGLKVDVDRQGRFRFAAVPAGTWEVLAHMHSLSDQRQRVEVKAGETTTVRFELELAVVHEQVTVTASGREETALETFLSIASVGQLDTGAKSGSTSLGDLLADLPGIHKRSFGPGTTRPVVRGFDGDRVLVLEDGVRTGTLSSQSGDHGEPIDPAQVERVEVVRGPATLLYGSSALGGVINAVSPVHDLQERPHPGLAGNMSFTAGSGNSQVGGGGNFRVGLGNWMLWGGGGRMKVGDYSAPTGPIPNSKSDLNNTQVGVGRYSERFSFNVGYRWNEGRYGVPFAAELGHHSHDHDDDHDHEFAKGPRRRLATDDHDDVGAEDVDLAFDRHQVRFTTTVRDLGRYFEQFSLKLNYTDWHHQELEGQEVGTEFFNRQFIYRAELQQRRRGRWSGTVGLWGMARDFKARGEEALSPPITQSGFAVFALEEVSFERFRLQFGGRMEHNGYTPEGGLRNRSFTGASASAGINVAVTPTSALVANYTHTYRAPALEELYYRGPHVGNLTYEIGDPALGRERGHGIDLSLRKQGQRIRGETNFFHYRLSDFIYLAPTGEVEHGLIAAEYSQARARFTGAEAKLQYGLNDRVWLSGSVDAVRASVRTGAGEQPLPRIPPLRGRLGVDFRHKSLTVRPELVAAAAQDRLFGPETRTAGYVVPNLQASYSVARQHVIHVFSVNFFNMSNRVYRNHLSFIKDLAPEMGRGVRFSYNVHFY